MRKLPSKKQDKKIGSKVKSIEEVLDCTKHCPHFPYGCMGCTEQEIYENNI
jgi:hypothetical protein